MQTISFSSYALTAVTILEDKHPWNLTKLRLIHHQTIKTGNNHCRKTEMPQWTEYMIGFVFDSLCLSFWTSNLYLQRWFSFTVDSLFRITGSLRVIFSWCVFFWYLAPLLPLSLNFLLLRFAAGKLVFVVFFFPLHAPVLKPDLDLPLGEGQCVRHFDAPLAGQVRVEQELFLQFQRLIAAVGLPAPSPAGSYLGGKKRYFRLNSVWSYIYLCKRNKTTKS